MSPTHETFTQKGGILSLKTAVVDDYMAVTSETVVFVPNGDDVVCLPVTLLDDNLLEGEESFPLQIDSVSPTPGVVTGDRDTTTVRILDNDSRLPLW